MALLVTGAAGFIGCHLVRRLCHEGHDVIGIDNLNRYYDVTLKQARLTLLQSAGNFRFYPMDIVDKPALTALFGRYRFERVFHLAAQAGVRYSLDNPDAYAQSNLVGFLNILESCRQYPPDHLIYASSSSVYGANTEMPFCEDDRVDQPVSLYAATKRANELLAQSYCHLYGLQATGLRFFTVYGPWGRPDMALFKFTEAMLQGREISLFNGGEMSRDFTYIDDVVEVLYRLQDQCPAIDGDRGINRLFNVGCGNPVTLRSFVECLEEALGIKAQIRFLPMQEGDVLKTWADVSSLERSIGFTPKVRIDQGVKAFVNWYRDFYQI